MFFNERTQRDQQEQARGDSCRRGLAPDGVGGLGRGRCTWEAGPALGRPVSGHVSIGRDVGALDSLTPLSTPHTVAEDAEWSRGQGGR